MTLAARPLTVGTVVMERAVLCLSNRESVCEPPASVLLLLSTPPAVLDQDVQFCLLSEVGSCRLTFRSSVDKRFSLSRCSAGQDSGRSTRGREAHHAKSALEDG